MIHGEFVLYNMPHVPVATIHSHLSCRALK